jgi:hypothetical protein
MEAGQSILMMLPGSHLPAYRRRAKAVREFYFGLPFKLIRNHL